MYIKQLLCAYLFMILGNNLVEGAVSPEQMEKIAKSMRNSCLQKIDTDEETVLNMRKGIFPDDQNLACYTHCVMKLMRTFKNDAVDLKMLIRTIEASTPPALAANLINTAKICSTMTVTTTDVCQLSYAYVKCAYNTDPENFFFP